MAKQTLHSEAVRNLLELAIARPGISLVDTLLKGIPAGAVAEAEAAGFAMACEDDEDEVYRIFATVEGKAWALLEPLGFV
jgi:hypothetical protein